MRSRKIKALLVEKGIKQVAIARELGVSKPTICKVIAGNARSRRVEEKIAALLGRQRDELW